MDLFKKSSIVGVSVTPEIGLEVAEIDFETKTILKYASKPLDYNINSRQVADMDIFKESLQDLFTELEISKTAKVILNIPAVTYRVAEFPAMMDDIETTNAITEALLANPLFENEEPCYSAAKLPTSSIQFNKIVYTAAQHNVISEFVMSIKDLGYKVYAIDTSIDSVLNALNYIGRLDNIQQDTSWVLMMIDGFSCRVMPMIGNSAIDVYEERISIGEVLGDAENYSTVLNAVSPILRNTPSQYLYVVSKTNLISAEILAGKIQYNAPIIHEEVNSYARGNFLEAAPSVDADAASRASLDVIGACIRREMEPFREANLNLYNKTLGDLYLMDQPPQIVIAGRTIVLTPEFLVKAYVMFALVVLLIFIPVLFMLGGAISAKNKEQSDIDNQIAEIQRFLDENKDISTDTFDEGDEIKTGLIHNKAIYSYYTIVGTEIPKKLWLTHLKLGEKVTIEGQADNLESIYGFYRSIKDYDQESDIKLQKLGLAAKSGSNVLSDSGDFDTESVLTSLNADFYEFRISNEPEISQKDIKDEQNSGALPDNLEPIN